MGLNLPKVIGHRGLKDIAPENTIESIKYAISKQIKWIEVDVKISKDQIPFLLHDDTLDRTTSGSGLPINYYYSEIKKMDAGLWFYKYSKRCHIYRIKKANDSVLKFVNSYPPTLREVLDLCYNNEIGINIELKPNKGFEKQNALAVANLIKNTKYLPKYYFSSFDWISLIEIKKLLPSSYIGILIDEFGDTNYTENILKKCAENNFFCCGLNRNIATKKNILLFKEKGMKVTVYGDYDGRYYKDKINDELYYKNSLLWQNGVDSIFVDSWSEDNVF